MPDAPQTDPTRARVTRQAVVIVHGMGEQKPGDTLRGFMDAALPRLKGEDPDYYSKPDTVTGSFEARRFLSPRRGRRPQAEFFEYHWAHLMQGNRLDDLWPTFRRILLLPPHRVPNGLLVVWMVCWAAVAGVVWLVVAAADAAAVGDKPGGILATVVGSLFGAGATAAVASYVISRVLPRWLTTSFVDVARYLDTSPRSYEVRRQIRKGFVDLLTELHDQEYRAAPRYQRIVVVAHSLGGYIAYDGLTYLWAQMNHGYPTWSETELPGVADAEAAAKALPNPASKVPSGTEPGDEQANFLAAQRTLWTNLRAEGHPWRITDLVTAGTPMYFADRLATRNSRDFRQRIARGELATCPPIPDPALPDDGTNVHSGDPSFTWHSNRRVLHEAAPFAVVRWTNAWFPAKGRFFGDWFGGALAPLFGPGVLDVEVRGNRRGPRPWLNRLMPGFAHTLYFQFPEDNTPTSVTTVLRDALALDLEGFPEAVHSLS